MSTNNKMRGPIVQHKQYDKQMTFFIKELKLKAGDIIPTIDFYEYCNIISKI